ncbi:hypothetical protein DCAR_0831708 [Daucus carota subsp. sativus]|uniref:Uncharacterized protein n=1 Tax=Daucus carota subsp. sativus TaxID=79200 RepID=A0A175YNI5_DAUCS|nr:hypothetical protein DCAR_0831708 [Daucus carota subsp. sativus]
MLLAAVCSPLFRIVPLDIIVSLSSHLVVLEMTIREEKSGDEVVPHVESFESEDSSLVADVIVQNPDISRNKGCGSRIKSS